MGWCMTCGKTTRGGAGWCPECHAGVVHDMHAREAHPVGGLSCPEPEGPTVRQAWRARKAWRTRREKQSACDEPSIKECKLILAEFTARHVHVKGSGFYALDDMGSAQENALRAWEESA